MGEETLGTIGEVEVIEKVKGRKGFNGEVGHNKRGDYRENEKTIPIAFYNFSPIKAVGRQVDLIKLDEANLFLDVIQSSPEENSTYKVWEGFCSKKRHSYIIAEGTIREEIKTKMLERKARKIGGTVEDVLKGKDLKKKGHCDYSLRYPDKIYGFFRIEDEIKR